MHLKVSAGLDLKGKRAVCLLLTILSSSDYHLVPYITNRKQYLKKREALPNTINYRMSGKISEGMTINRAAHSPKKTKTSQHNVSEERWLRWVKRVIYQRKAIAQHSRCLPVTHATAISGYFPPERGHTSTGEARPRQSQSLYSWRSGCRFGREDDKPINKQNNYKYDAHQEGNKQGDETEQSAAWLEKVI